MPQDQRGDTKDQPNVKATSMDDWFKKPNKPLKPDRPWNDGKFIDSRPPQKWINNISKARQPPRKFDELMSSPIDFSTYVMHNLKIDNLIQEILVGPTFNLLKGTSKSFVELEYHFEESQGRQVVPADYFFNNDLEYPKGRSSSSKYITSTTKTKATKYDNIEGIEDMVMELWSPVKVAYDKFAMWGISHWGPKRQKFYGYASNKESKHDVFSSKESLHQNWRDQSRDIPLDSVEVLRDFMHFYQLSHSELVGIEKVLLDQDESRFKTTCSYLTDKGKDIMKAQKAQRIKPTLYDGSVISSQHAVILVIDDEETLILKEILVNIFLQQELSAEQAFSLKTSHPNTDQSDISPVKIKAPIELLKVLVNTSLKKLKYHLDVPSSSYLVNDKFSRLFSGTVRFRNDQIAKITSYGDYQLANVTISRNLDGVDLLLGSKDINLYTISLDDMLKTSSFCLLSKASKTKSCLWHRRLSHLNFGTLNKLAKDGLARGIPKLKFKKEHMCSAYALGKSEKSSHQPKAEDSNQEKLYLLHMDLCGPMRVKIINEKKYILVSVDDYSRFTWVTFL
nr:hypothetical protein [Tanacetum cinerariifolium]